jgi:hypothetical protein
LSSVGPGKNRAFFLYWSIRIAKVDVRYRVPEAEAGHAPTTGDAAESRAGRHPRSVLMTISPSVPLTGEEYRREFAASIDVPAMNRVLVRGRMTDAGVDIEHTWLLSLPDYEVLEATARQHKGDISVVAPELCSRYAGITGVRIGRGFSKRILSALGSDLPGASAHLLLAVDMARVGQQVFQFPPEFDERFPVQFAGPSGLALASWAKDRAYTAALANSCFTYRDQSEAVFRERAVVCNFGSDISRPVAGTENVFWRRKQLTIRAAGEGFACASAMQDNVHEIGVRFTLDGNGTIASASSLGDRLPYSGLCESPHLRVKSLVGLRLTKAYVDQFADRVGGSQGCTHLFDLSIDCLRLFRFED